MSQNPTAAVRTRRDLAVRRNWASQAALPHAGYQRTRHTQGNTPSPSESGGKQSPSPLKRAGNLRSNAQPHLPADRGDHWQARPQPPVQARREIEWALDADCL